MKKRIFIVHRVGDQWLGYEQTWSSKMPNPKQYKNTHDLKGKTTRYVIASEDTGFSRAAALAFAVAVHEGKYRTIHVDLSEVSIT